MIIIYVLNIYLKGKDSNNEVFIAIYTNSLVFSVLIELVLRMHFNQEGLSIAEVDGFL